MPRARRPRQGSPPVAPEESGVTAVADAAALHSAAVRLLRLVRAHDDAGGLTAPRASALSVLVFGGPMTLGALARAEQVRPPTITRLVQGMTRDGLVRLSDDGTDARVRRIAATTKGRRLLLQARDRRVGRLAALLAALPAAERRLVVRATGVLAGLVARAATP
jgi:DNA-binding MarR family transcriptional regulator